MEFTYSLSSKNTYKLFKAPFLWILRFGFRSVFYHARWPLKTDWMLSRVLSPQHSRTQSLKRSWILNDARQNVTFIYDRRSSADNSNSWERSRAAAARRSPKRRRSVFRKTQKRRLKPRTVNLGFQAALLQLSRMTREPAFWGRGVGTKTAARSNLVIRLLVRTVCGMDLDRLETTFFVTRSLHRRRRRPWGEYSGVFISRFTQ